MKKTILMPIILLATLFLAACGVDSLEGDYVSKPQGNNSFSAATIWQKFSFRDDGTGSILTIGNNVTNFEYKIVDDKVILITNLGATLMLSIEKDGSITGMGAQFIKQE